MMAGSHDGLDFRWNGRAKQQRLTVLLVPGMGSDIVNFPTEPHIEQAEQTNGKKTDIRQL